MCRRTFTDARRHIPSILDASASRAAPNRRATRRATKARGVQSGIHMTPTQRSLAAAVGIVAATSMGCGSAPLDRSNPDESDPQGDLGTTTQAVQAGTYAWVRSSNSTVGARYNAEAAFSFNSGGGTNVIQHQGLGVYRVEMPNIGGAGGNVQVTSFGEGNERCKITSWVSVSGTIYINVRCDTPQGNPVNTRFTATYVRNSQGWMDNGAYVYATQPTTASYPADPVYSYNMVLNPNSITRSGTGSYTVQMNNLVISTVDKGNPLVTAVGDNPAYCNITGWGLWGTHMRVNVLCHTLNGAPADSKFSLSFSGYRVYAPNNWGAFAWANNPTAAVYTPSTLYSDTSSEDIPGITEPQARPQGGKVAGAGAGAYFIDYPYMPALDKTTANVTAVSPIGSYCKLSSWSAAGVGTQVRTKCFSKTGVPTDTEYSQRYTTYSFL